MSIVLSFLFKRIEQSMKLKASESTQAALLSAKGVLQSSYSGEKQLEAMMEEANALYAEGKVAEAQDKIDEISIYSKEIYLR